MTEIDFYSGGDKLHTACRLVAKAVRKGLKVMVYSSDVTTLEGIDKLLWTFSPMDFIPHCRADHKLADVTPVVLGHNAKKIPHDEVLVSLRNEVPPFFSRFQRLIEIVSAADETDKREARERYRHYRDRGYELRNHNMAQASS